MKLLKIALFSLLTLSSSLSFAETQGEYNMRMYDTNYPNSDPIIREVELYLNNNLGRLSQQEIKDAENRRMQRITYLMKVKYFDITGQANAPINRTVVQAPNKPINTPIKTTQSNQTSQHSHAAIQKLPVQKPVQKEVQPQNDIQGKIPMLFR